MKNPNEKLHRYEVTRNVATPARDNTPTTSSRPR